MVYNIWRHHSSDHHAYIQEQIRGSKQKAIERMKSIAMSEKKSSGILIEGRDIVRIDFYPFCEGGWEIEFYVLPDNS